MNPSPRGSLDASPLIVLGVLLALPCYALSQVSRHVAWPVLGGAALTLSVLTFLAYRSDKRRAEAGAQRISEATLHALALMGGWPGAFLGQRMFRHKTSKLSFQFVFWFVVLVHQFAAIDSLLDWRLSKDAIRAVKF